jgi:ribokinase
MSRILVIGSVNMDLVLELERVPAPGENLIGTRYSYVPGGKGANQAVAAARLGADVSFVARVGGDEHGEKLREGLRGEGVDVSRVVMAGDAPSGLAVIAVEKSGQNRIMVYPGANMTLDEKCVVSAFETPYDAVMLQLEVPDAVVGAAFREAGKRGIAVVLDAGPARPFDLATVRGIDILSPNQSETTALSGLPCETITEAERAAAVLSERSEARAVVIKLGAQGALVVAGGAATHVPPFRVKAVDPTAAGDAFTAAMTVRWLETGDMRESVRFGCAAGGLAASVLGAQPSLPRRAAVERLLQQ